MNEKYTLQVLELKLTASLELLEQIATEQKTLSYEKSLAKMPEWITLEKAHELKGGGALNSYKSNRFLQPCCGQNARFVCGRKSWHKTDVIEWLEITDSKLKSYAEKFGVKIPKTYEKRSK